MVTEDNILKVIRDVLATIMGLEEDEVTPTTSFSDLGFDNFDFNGNFSKENSWPLVIHEITDRLGVGLDSGWENEGFLSSFKTIEDLISALMLETAHIK